MTPRTILTAAAFSFALTSGAFAEETYVITASADYSGPFADVMPYAMAGLRASVAWLRVGIDRSSARV